MYRVSNQPGLMSIYPTSRPARRVNNAQSQSEYKLALVGSAFSYADRLVRLVKEDVPTENQCEFDEVDSVTYL